MKRIIKILSVIMATIMFFSVFSAANPAIAAEIQEAEMTEDTQTTHTSENTDDTEAEVEILNEITDLRDEYTKHFRQSDGSYIAAKYSSPVHYQKNGKWVEYDFTIEENNSGKIFSTDSVFSPASSDIPVKFPSKLSKDGNNEISIDVADTTITFLPKTSQQGLKNASGDIAEESELLSAEVVNGDTVSTYSLNSDSAVKSEEENALGVDKRKGAVKYENVFEDVDLEYEISSNVIKESIVLEKKQDKNIFEFTMDLGTLYPKKEQDGSIVLYTDSGYTNAQSVIAPPYMLDSNGVYSDLVSMELTPDGDKYTLTITADKNWLDDKQRVYPVIIDPTILLDINRQNTIDCYVDASSPNASYPYDYYLYAGHSTWGKTRTYVKFNLPELPDECCVIQEARLTIVQMSVDAGSEKRFISVHTVNEDWNNTTLSPTWDDQPEFATTALDYAELTYGFCDVYMFDITRAAKSWFENGNNYGVVIKGYDESKVGRAQIISAEYDTTEVAYPTITVTYRNNKGYEDYWTYTSFSAGGAVGSVNDYTGNAVVEIPLASSVSEIMPVSLSLVYNTYTAKQKYVSGKESSFLTTPGRGWKLNIQETVLKSNKYGLSEEDAKIYPYVYMDGDGTEHYFKKVTKKDDNGNEVTVLEDEDNLGLTLDDKSTDNYKYKITDKNDTQYLFNGKGNLGIIQDSNGNKIQIHFNDDRTKITKVTDGTGHTFSFTYHISDEGIETDYLEKITDNSGRETKLHLPGGYLDTVTYYDKSKISIVYEDAENLGDEDFEGLVSYLITSDGEGFNFDYTTKATGRRVRQIMEIGTDPKTNNNVAGQIITFNRTEYNTTVIRSGGIDGITYDPSTTENKTATEKYKKDDVVTTLQFDNSGKTISQQVSYGDGSEVGAGAYDYGNGSGNKNRVTDSATLGKNTVNLLTNPNAESLDGWSQVTSGTLTTQKTLASDFQYTGKNSIKISNTAIETNGANSYYRQIVSGTYDAKSYYTLSAFVKTSNIVKQGTSGYQGAYIQLAAYDASGSLVSKQSQLLMSATETGINNGWRRLSVTIQIPSDKTATKLTAYLCLRNATGEAYFDCMQLEKGEVPTAVNLLENSSFEKQNSNGTPSDWTTAGDCDILTDKVTSTQQKDGSRSIVINGGATLSSGYKQIIPVQPNENDTYIVSGWAMADAVNSTFHSHYEKDGETITDEAANEIFTNTNKKDDETVELVADTKFEIAVAVEYKKTDEKDVSTKVTQYKDPASFNTTISGWQYAATAVSLKYTDGEEGYTYTPTHIYVIPRYNKQVNCAYFDHIQLIKDAAQSYVYDDKGNLVSVTANAEQKNNMEYDGEDNLTEYKDAIGCTTTFEYQEKTHNLLSVKTPKGVTSKYTYNTKGQATVSETQNKAGELKIKTETGYTVTDSASGIKAGAYVSYTSDEHGNRTTYGYDMATGGLKTITDANDVTTTNNYYTYTDSAGNVKKDYAKLETVSSGNSKVSYTYDGNRIKTITFGNDEKYETYSFKYDAYGNIEETKVGSVPLSTNTYGTRNGALQQSEYANNDVIAYEYDNSGRVIKEIKTDTTDTSVITETPYLWSYSVDGTPRTHTDNENNLKYSYSYDSIGRLIRTDIQDTSSNGAVGSIEYGFNSRGHMTSLKSEIGGRLHAQAYSYSKITNSKDEILNNSLENGKDGLPTRYKISSSRYADYSYDSLNRLNLRTFSTTRPLYNNYIYKTSERDDGTGTYRTNQLAIEIIDNTAYRYTYDNVGNITKVEKGERTTQNSSDTATGNYSESYIYSYDELGQLISECKNTTDKLYFNDFTYDKLGNITNQKSYWEDSETLAETSTKEVNYTYGTNSGAGWKYLLTGLQTTTYDNEGKATTITESIAYDKIGNPINYRGASMSWYGRQMTSYSKGDVSAIFTYDADGLRGSKTVDGAKTTYFYVGDKLYYQHTANADGTTNYELYFYYDSYGKLSAIKYYLHSGTTVNEYTYYVSTNASGDVLGLYGGDGVLRVSYEYDAWGNVISVCDAAGNEITNLNSIAHRNPIRYRGYYYDNDLGLYYLQSRYYDSTIGRFINADSYITTGQGILSYNMFAYCGNNPVNRADPTGHFWRLLLGLAIAIVVLTLDGCSSSSNNASTNASVSTTSASKSLTEEQKHFVSVVAGEAIGANEKTQKAVAHTIMNRLKEPRDVWSNAKTVSDILVKNQYNAVDSEQYNQCMAYLNNRDGTNESYENLINAVIPIYDGKETDFTGGAHYIFNVNESASLLASLKAQPNRYVRCPSVSGVDDEEYCMYRCLW